MFGSFFESKPKGPEEIERSLYKIADKEFSNGVNSPAIKTAFEALRKKNKGEGLGLTNDHLLNIVKGSAYSQSSIIDDQLSGGPEETFHKINEQIENLRKSLPEEEQGD